jgi:endonuclease YncB( thermonuclease family)
MSMLHLEALAPMDTMLSLKNDVESQDRYSRTLAYPNFENGRTVNEALLRPQPSR